MPLDKQKGVQGAQFTSAAFTSKLEAAGVAISMDGRGRFMDNIFIERLWRSIKYEEVHLKAYADGREALAGIGSWMTFYNRASQHPSVYVIEEKRLCWSGCDPVGYFGFCRARSVMDRAADVVRAARAKIQGPSGKGWMASISPASAASLRVFGVICMSRAALLRLSQGSIPIFGWLVHWNAVMRAQRGDALTCPAVAVTRDEAIPVEDAGDDIVIGDQHELANSGNHIG